MKKLLLFLLMPLFNAGYAQHIISTVAGSGTAGYSGDNGAATAAKLDWPAGVAVDGAGNMYIADMGNNVVRKVNTSGIITTIAGNGYGAGTGVGLFGTGSGGYTGDGAAATAAQLWSPNGVAVDAAGNLYIADAGNDVVRKVSAAGIITTFAGGGIATVDGIPATSANLWQPTDVAVDAAGNVYIADNGHDVVKKVTTAGLIYTVAGDGTSGNSGNGGAATAADMSTTSVRVDAAGNLYIADGLDAYVRKVSSAGIITTLAGDGSYGYGGDGGPGTAATLNNGPMGIAVDGSGNVFISDVNNEKIRKISTADTITTFAGTSQGYGGDGGPATACKLRGPQGLATDAVGNVYIADWGNNRIRRVKVSSAYVANVNAGSDIKIYPNPVTDMLTIENAVPGSSVRIYNTVGQQLYAGDIGSEKELLNTRNMAPGLYLLQITGKEGYRTTKTVTKQ